MSWETDEGPKLRNTFDQAANFFEVGQIIDTKRVGGNANKNYVVTTDQGDYVFKLIIEHPRKDLEDEIQFLERLAQYNFPASYYQKSPQGNSIYESNGDLIVSMPKLNGENPTLSPEVCAAIGQNIAKLHTIPSENLPNRNHWLRQTYLEDTISKVEKEFPDEAKKIRAEQETLKSFNYQELPMGIVHGDMSASNCLFVNNQLTAMLDWEEVGIAPVVLDLATCILNLCYQDNKLNPELYQKILESYQTVRPLSSLEKTSLASAMKYAGLTLSVWRLAQFGIHHPDPEKIKDYEDYWKMNLDTLQLPS